ncbi:MAG: efflux RND transporter permease subunit [Spongiibacteraceae bacterium]
MARFFIDRPVFAWVIAIVIMLAGVMSIFNLPVERLPSIAPPAVKISASYPGASAQVVENSVTQIIEQNMKGLDGLLYMSATSDSAGNASITLTFENGTDPDISQVQVQNKLQLATPLLPQAVQEQGISVTKTNSGFLLVVGFTSQNGSMTASDIDDFIGTNLLDVLSRVPGVGETRLMGSKYAMRIWLDPGKLDTYKLTITDVTAAIQAQNQQVAIGQLGGTPAVSGQQLNATIDAQGRLQTVEQFRDIVIRSNNDGSVLTLGDIARVELGAENYNSINRINGVPASAVGITLGTGANAVATSTAVKETLAALAPSFPEGLETLVPYDTTPFIAEAIKGVVATLVEAVILVFVVMFLFMQNFRATLIPTIAVPVVLLGTLAILFALGYSINMLTMFAMVLAIGLLVDDAIVVVENVERLMSEEGLSPLEATRKSMDQITGALVAIGLVLSAVFIPMAFFGGSTGVIYRQFSVTIVSAMGLSVLVAIVLTPALCATMLKPMDKEHQAKRGFFGWFNRMFDRSNKGYQHTVGGILSRRKRYLAVFAVIVAMMVMLFIRLPAAFLPDEDQGLLLALVQAPAGATQERTMGVVRQFEKYFLEKEQDTVHTLHTVQGFSFAGSGQNMAMAFISLKDWDVRDDPGLGVDAIIGRAMGALGQIKDAFVYTFSPPAIMGLGTASGFSFYLKDNIGLGHNALLQARNQLLGAAAQSPLLTNMRPGGMEDTPVFRIDIDNQKAAALGLSTADINNTLATAWGGRYIDDFIDRGRVKRVYIQADAPYRMQPEDFKQWSVRNAEGKMVSFSSFASYHWEYGSPRLERYNGLPAVQIDGEAAAGVSSSTAMDEIEKIVANLMPGITMEWTGASYLQRVAGNQAPLLYALSIIMVFLCLAALYESWMIPTAILLAAPFGVLGAVLANTFRGMERDVYFQVAMMTTIGLSSKNAILIVEFAKANYEQGMELVEATMAAVRDRLRPIIMTSLAFGLGVLPLAIASGAGSGAQQAIGTGVVGGMLAGTFLGIFFVPLFFVVIQSFFKRDKKYE